MLRSEPSRLESSLPVLGVLAAPGLRGNVIVSVPVQDVLDGPSQVLCALCCLVEGHITLQTEQESMALIRTTSCSRNQQKWMPGKPCAMAWCLCT